jgi:hypothetical protein
VSGPCSPGSTEVLFLQVDFHVVGQRRHEKPSAAVVVLDDLVKIVLPIGIATALVSSPSLTAVAVGAVVHIWVIPRARRQVLGSRALRAGHDWPLIRDSHLMPLSAVLLVLGWPVRGCLFSVMSLAPGFPGVRNRDRLSESLGR